MYNVSFLSRLWKKAVTDEEFFGISAEMLNEERGFYLSEISVGSVILPVNK